MNDLKSAVLLFAIDLNVVHQKIPEASLSDKISNVLSDAIRHYLLTNVKLVKASIHTLITTLAKHKAKEVELVSVFMVSNEIIEIIEKLINQYKVCFHV
jgi:hypothetical protein